MIYKIKREQLILFILVLLMIVSYFAGLFVDITRDAAKYAYISKEMVESGDWFNLQIHGDYYTQKPQFLFWLSAVSYKLFGISNFSFKLPILIYSFLGFFFLFRLGQALYDSATGKLATLILMFSVISVLYNMDIHTDIVLQTNITLALWLLFLFLKDKKAIHLIGSGFALGLIILTKGPFGLMVPFFAVVGYCIFSGRYKEIFHWKWFLLVLVALIFSLPAWLFYFNHWGWKGIVFFAWTNNVGRANGSYSTGNTPDLLFFVHNLFYLFIPWSLLFFLSSVDQFKKLFRKQLAGFDHYLFWGIWIVFILLSLSKSKLPNYIQCVLPLMAIQTARYWQQCFRVTNQSLKVYQLVQEVMIYTVSIVTLLMLVYFFPVSNMLWIMPVVLAFLVLHYTTRHHEASTKLLLRSLAALTVVGLVLNFHVFPYLFRNQAQVVAAEIINTELKPGEKVYHYKPMNLADREAKRMLPEDERKHPVFFNDENHFYLNYELLFNCRYPVEEIVSEEQLRAILSVEGRWLFTDENGLKPIGELAIQPYSVKTLSHFNLSRFARYINPESRKRAMANRYLIHTSDSNK
jgi:4-amino-4-deoxy-L-arabinose transferase-like glycosyltransferase